MKCAVSKEQSSVGLLNQKQFCDSNPGIKESSVNWFVHRHKDDLVADGALVYMGRKRLFNSVKFVRFLQEKGEGK